MSRARLTLAGAWLCLAACRQLIGIEPADEDPSLLAATDGGAKSVLGVAEAGQESEPEAGATSAAGGEAALGDTGTAGQAGESAAGAAGAADVPTPCERYCTAVMANCTGSFAVYGSHATCLALCRFMPQGADGDRAGNSVQCRLHAAQAAPSEVPHYCPIAGPGGNGVCGSNCESLCQLRSSVCADHSAGDEESCLTACAKLEDRPTYSTDPSVGLYEGAHVQCRLYHLSAAASDDPAGHCPHVDGEPPCQ